MTGKLVSIYSSKGGTGKSFIAANLSVDLHLETKKRVLLVDFTLPYSSDISKLLGLKETKKIEGLLSSAKNLSPSILKSFATSHSSGIFTIALSGGEKMFYGDQLDPSDVESFFNKLLESYDFVVVDVGMKYDPVVECIFDISNFILLPVIPDFLSVQQARADLNLMRAKNFSRDMIKLILNMYEKTSALNKGIIEGQLSKELSAIIPFDNDVFTKFADGKTYPDGFPLHEITKAFDKLAFQIANEKSKPNVNRAGVQSGISEGDNASASDIDSLKVLIHERLLQTIDFKRLDTEVEDAPEKMEELRNTVLKIVVSILDSETSIRSRDTRSRIVKEVLQDVLGLGPLEDLLAAPDITEIMVNRWNEIYVEKNGMLERSDSRFLSEQHLIRIIGRIVAPVGRKIDVSTPMVDARLKDGSRVNAIIPPLAIRGASLTIRKFPKERMGVDDLIRLESINEQIAEFLRACVMSRLNILISGGTGTGKTTFLNILSGFIPSDERIITIEDSAELKLQQPHVVTLEARPPNIENKGEVTIRDLVKNSLRMRPDRIVVGECRSGEALDMLQAMNTGHDGSLTTIHANSNREALSRIETLVMFAGFEMPSKAIREQIVGAINLIVQIKRFKDGTRKVVNISEVTGMEGNVITTGDIFHYKQSGLDDGKVQGNFVSTGYVPKCLDLFEERGITIPREIFWTTV